MSQIVLHIPTSGSNFVEGECELLGFEKMILCDRVSYEISVETDDATDGRRTIHAPTLSAITIERDVDIATATLSRLALTETISASPWSLYFLKSATEGIANGGSSQPSAGVPRHMCYIELLLTHPLITKQEISMEEEAMRETLEISATDLEWHYRVMGEDHRELGFVGFRFDVQAGTVG